MIVFLSSRCIRSRVHLPGVIPTRKKMNVTPSRFRRWCVSKRNAAQTSLTIDSKLPLATTCGENTDPLTQENPPASESDSTSTADPVSVKQGRLDIIIGPMFSGKTTKLMQKIEVDEAAGLDVLAVKSELDTRYATTQDHKSFIVSHSGGKKECIAVAKLSTLKKLFLEAYDKADVIAIDEAQFLPDLLQFCQTAVDRDCKVVYVSGLDGDFRRKPFKLNERRASAMMQIIPLADSISKHNAKCFYCKAAAPFTFRTISDETEVLVGGADSYVPVCRRHYLIKWDETHSDASANGALKNSTASG